MFKDVITLENILLERWNNEVVLGIKKAEKPPLIPFINCDTALDMLDKHLNNRSSTLIHCDVDGDGIGSGKILIKTLGALGFNTRMCRAAINRERTHGITHKIVDVVKNNKIQFLIVLDSSTNELDIIKQIPCDVLVIDHHEVNHTELTGNTANGRYCVVNNTVSNSEYNREKLGELGEYTADDRMSCGLVVYEFLRLYFKWINQPDTILTNTNIHQWAAVTLLTDSIPLLCNRNQWYLEQTFYVDEMETTLAELLHRLNRYKPHISKSFINFELAPLLNKAIRAGQSSLALETVLYCPDKIGDLRQYGEIQAKNIEAGEKLACITENCITIDTSGTDISGWYHGVIASRMSGEYKRNCVCYHIVDGIAVGSFRGKCEGVDYRDFFNQFSPEIFAEGHKAAFGIKVPVHYLKDIMQGLCDIEPKTLDKPFLTAGNMPLGLQGVHHYYDLTEFKRQGLLLQLAVANSKLANSEVLPIITTRDNAHLERRRGKLFEYKVCGIACKAFEEMTENIVSIYVEYNREVEAYLRNYKA